MPPAVVAGIAAAATGAIVSKIMTPRQRQEAPEAALEAPKVEPIKEVMPTIDSETVEAARKKAMLRQSQRQGRASTILTGDKGSSDALGGGY